MEKPLKLYFHQSLAIEVAYSPVKKEFLLLDMLSMSERASTERYGCRTWFPKNSLTINAFTIAKLVEHFLHVC